MGGRGNSSTGPVRQASGVQYYASAESRARGNVMVRVDVDKVDDAFQANERTWNKSMGRDQRDYEAQIRSGAPVAAPEMAMEGRESVNFASRGQFRAILESGKKTMMVSVNKKEARRVRSNFGA